VFFLVLFALLLLDLNKWLPFALSASLVSSALLSLIGLAKTPGDSRDGLSHAH
jgi:hypothetical protein